MRYKLTFVLLCTALLAHLTVQSQTGWRWGIKNTGRGGMTSWPSAVDGTGNLILAGSTYGSAFTIDSMIFGSHIVYSTGHFDQMIVTKVDSGGNYLWAIGSQGAHARVDALSTDPSGNIFVVGLYSGSSITLGSFTLSNSTTYGMLFIEKVSPSGTVLWAQNIATAEGGSSPSGLGLGADGAGNAYVTGNFYQSGMWVGTSLLMNHDASGFTSDIFLLKYNAAGTLKWTRSFGGNHSDFPFIQGNYGGFDCPNNIMSVTPNGHIYLTGLFFSDSIKIGGTTLYNPTGGTTMPGPTYSYLCKWDSSGNTIWAKHVNRKMLVNEITSNAREEVYFAGILGSTDTFGSFILHQGALVAKMDSAGNPIWARTDSGGDAKSIGLDNSGNVFVTGNLGDSMNFSGHVLHVPAVHSAPMFVARYDTSGSYISSVAVPDGAVASCAVRPGDAGCYYLVGNFFGTPLRFAADSLDTAGVLSEATFIARYRYAGVSSATSPEREEEGYLQLYPNPANNILTIQSQQKMHSVEITDMLGRDIHSSKCDDESLKIDISNIPSGIYLVRINDLFVRKFVKE